MSYDLRPLSIAIVDANAFSRRLLRSLLVAIGFSNAKIKDMADAESALADLEHFAPDLILSEFELPGMGGVEFIRLVRQFEDETSRYVPIIVCTAHTDEKLVFTCRDAGAHEVLGKPISATALYQHIVSVIENPRPFIHASVFTGPDRRRREKRALEERRSKGKET